MYRGDGVGEIGVDANGDEIGDHENRRIAQGLAVPLQLGVSCIEIAVQPLELPGEVTALVHIGAAPLARRLPHRPLEGVPLLTGVELGRSAMLHQAADVKEPFLRPGRFLPPAPAPFCDEFLGGHCTSRTNRRRPARMTSPGASGGVGSPATIVTRSPPGRMISTAP